MGWAGPDQHNGIPAVSHGCNWVCIILNWGERGGPQGGEGGGGGKGKRTSTVYDRRLDDGPVAPGDMRHTPLNTCTEQRQECDRKSLSCREDALSSKSEVVFLLLANE